MPSVEHWIRQFASTKRKIKLRAASVLLDRAPFVPVDVLIDILKEFSAEGLGARTEKALVQCRDSELVPKTISLLETNDPFVREVACTVLGHTGDKRATAHLLRMLDDPEMMVRRAAGFGLAFLKDPSCVDELKERYERHQSDDTNVLMALHCALKSLGEIADD